MRHSKASSLLLVAVLATLAAVLAGIWSFGRVTSQENDSAVVDFTRITPVVVTGLPDRTPASIDPNRDPCQAPPDERPVDGLPPLSCRNADSEPPPGSLPTKSPNELLPTPDAAIPSTWRTIDNAVFRFTVAVPEGWYSNMRPEGGQFKVFDVISSQEAGTNVSLPGGIWISFSAREALLAVESGSLDLFPEEKLRRPTTSFGDTAAVIWEEEGGENLAKTIHAAFIRDGVIFEVYAAIQKDHPTPVGIEAATAQALAVINTIRPY